MNKMQIFLKRNSSTILTFVGVAGVIGTAVSAVKATPKAMELIEEAKEEKGCELTTTETIKVAWKPYIPTTIIGLSTIACILGANYLNTRAQASLMSAYALLDSSYQEYRKKANELYGEDADDNIKREIAKSKFDRDMILDNDKELFFDFESMQYFESTLEEVKRGEKIFNEYFSSTGYANLNTLYDSIGVPRVSYGYDMGWSTKVNDSIYGYSGVELEYEKATNDDGLECWIISMPCPPSPDYLY